MGGHVYRFNVEYKPGKPILRRCMHVFGEIHGLSCGSYISMFYPIVQTFRLTPQVLDDDDDMDCHTHTHTHTHCVPLQRKALAPRSSSSVRPPCTASPNSGFVMRTQTVQMDQTRLIAVSCENPLSHKSQPLHLLLRFRERDQI